MLIAGRILFFLLISIQSVLADPADNLTWDRVVPIVNAETTQTSISKNGLSAIFKMRLLKWQDGTPVTVYVLPDNDPLHKRFCKEVLNVFPHQMRRAWNKLVFSGSGQAPIEVKNIEEMIEKVTTTLGAIGYLYTQDIPDGIRILDIQ
jgi:ABC-type phosphate transport system substrate-binding protein